MATTSTGPSTGTVSRAVLLTGCSSGIGKATAERLARAGWTVYATARRPETLSDLEDAGCTPLALDVTDEESMQKAVAAVEAAEGAVGVLVNNAGYGQEGAVEETSIDAVRKQFETNVFGLLRLTQLVLPAMRAQGWGRVVNVSSVGGRMTFPGGGIYHASKYAVEALSDALRFELRGFGVKVIVIEPGLIRTGFDDAAVASMDTGSGAYAEFNRAVAERVKSSYQGVMGKLTSAGPESVAKVIESAISSDRPRARYVVTPAARGLVALRRFMPDAVYDAMMRTQFPTP